MADNQKTYLDLEGLKYYNEKILSLFKEQENHLELGKLGSEKKEASK